MSSRSWAETVDVYQAAWNEPDAAKMRNLLAEIFTADATIFDAAFPGPLKLEDFGNIIEYLRSNEPDNVVRFEEPREGHGWPWARVKWRVIEPGSEDWTGIAVAELDDNGRISRLVSFFDREINEVS